MLVNHKQEVVFITTGTTCTPFIMTSPFFSQVEVTEWFTNAHTGSPVCGRADPRQQKLTFSSLAWALPQKRTNKQDMLPLVVGPGSVCMITYNTCKHVSTELNHANSSHASEKPLALGSKCLVNQRGNGTTTGRLVLTHDKACQNEK